MVTKETRHLLQIPSTIKEPKIHTQIPTQMMRSKKAYQTEEKSTRKMHQNYFYLMAITEEEKVYQSQENNWTSLPALKLERLLK